MRKESVCVCKGGGVCLGSVNAAGGVSVHSASLGYLTSVLLSLPLICRKEAGSERFRSGGHCDMAITMAPRHLFIMLKVCVLKGRQKKCLKPL